MMKTLKSLQIRKTIEHKNKVFSRLKVTLKKRFTSHMDKILNKSPHDFRDIKIVTNTKELSNSQKPNV